MPIILAFSLWYFHSLKDTVFYLFLIMMMLAYFSVSGYFFNEKQVVDNHQE
ncbi:hypothetical protein RV13_GL003140 [Enterococcus raffinosus]|nr:hypothetical protein RV13_GL003140 [Enterococcus raffinosus]